MTNGDLGWITNFWGVADAAVRDLAVRGNLEEAPGEVAIGEAAA
jgi:hypothetical protein